MMRKDEIITKIAEQFAPAFTKKDIESIIEKFLEAITDALCERKRIEMRGFGNFELRKRKGRSGTIKKTGAEFSLPPRYVPFFKPSRLLKEVIQKRIKPEDA
jgi:nucleoid DNA-binding protein